MFPVNTLVTKDEPPSTLHGVIQDFFVRLSTSKIAEISAAALLAAEDMARLLS